jgi:polysaccharide export outer membrane protein
MRLIFSKSRVAVTLILILLFLGSSCVPLKKLRYLQDVPKEDTVSFFESKRKEYVIKTGDNLFIRIMSLDDKTSSLFNISESNPAIGSSPESTYLYSYSVNQDGKISLPMIGDILAEGLTVDELKKKIKSSVSEYLKESTVIIQIANFRVTILGEVKRPGPHYVSTNSINIFEAIALAGDLTTVANGKSVKLIRTTTNGTKIYNIDITDKKVLESGLFYLQPFDVLYVEPVKAKNFVFTQFPYTLIYATISTVFLLMAYLK